jgi:type I restriction enzyme S subunit
MRKVGEVSTQIRGVTYNRQDAADNALPGYLPVLRAGNIEEHGLTFDDLVYVPASKVSDKQRLRKNDVLIAASSGSIDVVGKAARALHDYDGGFGAFCKVLRPNGHIDPGYFAHYFQTPDYRRRVSFLAAGANINNLRNEDLDDLEIPLPPLAEQKRIAGILDAADALRAERREALAQLDTLFQATFLDLFGDPLSNSKGWKIGEVGDFVSRLTNGYVGPTRDVYKHAGVPYLLARHVHDNELEFDGKTFITDEFNHKLRKSMLCAGDVLLVQSGHIGESAVVPKMHEGHNCHAMIVITPVIEHLRGDYLSALFQQSIRLAIGIGFRQASRFHI